MKNVTHGLGCLMFLMGVLLLFPLAFVWLLLAGADSLELGGFVGIAWFALMYVFLYGGYSVWREAKQWKKGAISPPVSIPHLVKSVVVFIVAWLLGVRAYTNTEDLDQLIFPFLAMTLIITPVWIILDWATKKVPSDVKLTSRQFRFLLVAGILIAGILLTIINGRWAWQGFEHFVIYSILFTLVISAFYYAGIYNLLPYTQNQFHMWLFGMSIGAGTGIMEGVVFMMFGSISTMWGTFALVQAGNTIVMALATGFMALGVYTQYKPANSSLPWFLLIGISILLNGLFYIGQYTILFLNLNQSFPLTTWLSIYPFLIGAGLVWLSVYWMFPRIFNLPPRKTTEQVPMKKEPTVVAINQEMKPISNPAELISSPPIPTFTNTVETTPMQEHTASLEETDEEEQLAGNLVELAPSLSTTLEYPIKGVPMGIQPNVTLEKENEEKQPTSNLEEFAPLPPPTLEEDTLETTTPIDPNRRTEEENGDAGNLFDFISQLHIPDMWAENRLLALWGMGCFLFALLISFSVALS